MHRTIQPNGTSDRRRTIRKSENGDDTKRYGDGHAGEEAEPGQELRWRVGPGPLQQDRKQIGPEIPEPENNETKEDDKSREGIDDALRNAFHLTNQIASTSANHATHSAPLPQSKSLNYRESRLLALSPGSVIPAGRINLWGDRDH